MARPVSDDIFKLAFSLSHSEYQTLMDDAKSLHSNIPKGQKPAYLKLVDYFRSQSEFDDDLAREFVGIDHGEGGKWRSLKRDTIKMMEQAIDGAKSNQSNDVVVARIPSRIENLMGKGLWKRAGETVDKYLQIAIQVGQYETGLRLVKQKATIVSYYYPRPEAKLILQGLEATREDILAKLTNIEKFHRLWRAITLETRDPNYGDQSVVSSILNDSVIQEKKYLSPEAEIIYWKIIKRCHFLKGDLRQYVLTLEQGIKFFSNHDQKAEKIIELIKWSVNISFLMIAAHEYDESQIYRAKLKLLSESMSAYRSMINLDLLRLEQFDARCSLEIKQIDRSLSSFEPFAVSPHFYSNTRESIKCISQHSILHFLIQNNSEAVKWIAKIRHKSIDPTSESHGCFAWIFYLIIRLEQEEFEILKREFKSTQNFLLKYCPESVLYGLVLELIHQWSQPIQDQRKQEIEGIVDDITSIYDSPRLPKEANFFPFNLWSRTKLSNGELLSEMRKENRPNQNL
jgi:hypothetical protein